MGSYGSGKTIYVEKTFSCFTEDFKGHICDVGTGPQADQLTATTKALASYDGGGAPILRTSGSQ